MIEEQLERIAVALETLVAREAGANTSVAKAKKPTPVPVDAVPGVEDAPGQEVAPGPEEASVMMCRGITDSAGLQAFVQKALQASGTQANELVTFIRGTVCVKFSPKEPKLVKIPLANVPMAAQMVYDWCMKHDIIIAPGG